MSPAAIPLYSFCRVTASISCHQAGDKLTHRLTQGRASRGAVMNSSMSGWFASRWRTIAPFLYLPPRRIVSLMTEKIRPNDTGPDATTPDGRSCPRPSSFDRWIATPAPYRRPWIAYLIAFVIPSGPSREFLRQRLYRKRADVPQWDRPSRTELDQSLQLHSSY